jgi:hypothetical protein
MGNWENAVRHNSRKYKCYNCGSLVASDTGYYYKESTPRGDGEYIYICPHCHHPTYFSVGKQIPSPLLGEEVENLPDNVKKLYNEARECTGAGAYTAAVLACRKLLMHIAVEKGAKAGESFKEYVEYLSNKGYIPPDGKGWVDHIRDKGNEANHEIVIMSQDEAKDLITFLQMLLLFIYDFPSKVKAKAKP